MVKKKESLLGSAALLKTAVCHYPALKSSNICPSLKPFSASKFRRSSRFISSSGLNVIKEKHLCSTVSHCQSRINCLFFLYFLGCVTYFYLLCSLFVSSPPLQNLFSKPFPPNASYILVHPAVTRTAQYSPHYLWRLEGTLYFLRQ